MSMILRLHPISGRALEAFRANPNLGFAIVHFDPDEKAGAAPDPDLDACAAVERKSVAQMIEQNRLLLPAGVVEQMETQLRVELERALEARSLSSPSRRLGLLAAHALTSEDFGAPLDLGQAWHALHFALTGATDPDPSPLGRALLGGVLHGQNVGYGPLQYLEVAEVADTSATLERLKGEDLPGRLRTAIDEHRLHAFRPGPATGWVTESYDKLRGFYRLAVQRKQALVQSMT